MKIGLKDICSKRLVFSIIIFYMAYVIVLATFYWNQNEVADFLIGQGHDFGAYQDVSFVSLILGIVMNTWMFMFYILGLWLTFSIKNRWLKYVLLIIPVAIMVLILNETIQLYMTKAFYSDNVFWIEFTIRGVLYFLMLFMVSIVNKENLLKQ